MVTKGPLKLSWAGCESTEYGKARGLRNEALGSEMLCQSTGRIEFPWAATLTGHAQSSGDAFQGIQQLGPWREGGKGDEEIKSDPGQDGCTRHRGEGRGRVFIGQRQVGSTCRLIELSTARLQVFRKAALRKNEEDDDVSGNR
jgi:hypothetical protein